MDNLNYNIPKEKFEFAGSEGRLHDKELVTKPVSYFKDAWNRFRKNHASIVGAIVIAILVLYAIIAPLLSQYTVSYNDTYYKFTAPKVFEGTGFLDGTREKELNESRFNYFYAMGLETGHNAVVDQKFTVKTVTLEEANGKKDAAGSPLAAKPKTANLYKFRLDTYHQTGVIFQKLSVDEYKALQAYQDTHDVQIIFPITEFSKRPVSGKDGEDANYWYETKAIRGQTMPVGKIGEDGLYDFKEIYRHYTGKDLYTSKMRIEGDTPKYDYARKVQGDMYEVRVNYYEYYKYMHTEVLKDGITQPWFIFGTDQAGKDIFTCLASGARFSFILAISVATVNMLVGAIYGAIEGYYGGKIDIFMERIVEILSAVPFMIVVTLLKYHMDKTPQALLLFIAFFLTGWIGMAGKTRMQFYRFKNQEYVLAARTLGANDPRIMFKHIFPNSLGTLITSCVLIIPGMIFSETSLSYLGIINLNTGSLTSVGTLLSNAQPYLVTYPHMILFPSIFICLLMLSFNLFGNGLRDAFNPSLRGAED